MRGRQRAESAHPTTVLEENILPATCTFDGFGSYSSSGYWGKQGPEFLDRRLALYAEEQRMVLRANTFRQFMQVLGPGTEESEVPLRSHGSLSMNRALMAAGTAGVHLVFGRRTILSVGIGAAVYVFLVNTF
ncbi:hypothetical protein GCM10022419_125300 [Nonomuraea rosea]|uniref:Uncharacterized protein n=1 Tax=Nonomuraea rosea TaxID=638574 RepID=A0ABP6ZSL0_9ACTN